jgi:hypothetical protein
MPSARATIDCLALDTQNEIVNLPAKALGKEPRLHDALCLPHLQVTVFLGVLIRRAMSGTTLLYGRDERSDSPDLPDLEISKGVSDDHIALEQDKVLITAEGHIFSVFALERCG